MKKVERKRSPRRTGVTIPEVQELVWRLNEAMDQLTSVKTELDRKLGK